MVSAALRILVNVDGGRATALALVLTTVACSEPVDEHGMTPLMRAARDVYSGDSGGVPDSMISLAREANVLIHTCHFPTGLEQRCARCMRAPSSWGRI